MMKLTQCGPHREHPTAMLYASLRDVRHGFCATWMLFNAQCSGRPRLLERLSMAIFSIDRFLKESAELFYSPTPI